VLNAMENMSIVNTTKIKLETVDVSTSMRGLHQKEVETSEGF